MPPKTWKTIADQRRKENFVGRAEQLKVFTDNFSGDVPNWMVLSITGEGGVGKSTLLKRYTQECQRPEINANVVLCDDHQYSPVDAMAAIADQLKNLGIESKNFNERQKKYRETLQQIESDPSAPRGMVDVVTHGLTDFAVKSLRRAPGIGLAMDYVDEKAAGDALTELAHYTLSRWGNKDEVQLVREPEKILTPLFVDLLNEAAGKKRLVVMFDVFERTAATLSNWLIALFNSQYGEFALHVSFILSGRDPLEQHWTELAGLMTHVQLEPFTEEETTIYLSNQGLTDETLVKQIYDDTGGLPVLVELLAAANPQIGQSLPDYTQRAVERFLQWAPDADKRRVALLASIPRQFNLEILSVLLGENAEQNFRWLAGQSYIRTNQERGWYYHEKVRELMLRHQRNLAPGELSENHKKLAQLFTDIQPSLTLNYEDEKSLRQEAERVYHFFSADPQTHWMQMVHAFLIALHYHSRFAATLVSLAKRVLSETQCPSGVEKEVLELDSLLVAYENDDNEKLLRLLNRLENLATQEKGVETIFFARRGLVYSNMGNYENALNDFNHAIELDNKYSRAIARRGETYRLMGKHDKALADFTQAIKLNEKDVRAIAERGQTYYQLGQYEQALSDFNRVIELDESNDQAVTARGDCYFQMRRYEEAIRDFTLSINLNEKNSYSLAFRGLTHLQMNNTEDALADFTHAIEIDEKFAWAIAKRGEVYYQMEKFNDAIVDFTRAIELDEKDSWSIAYRGLTYFQLDRNDEALVDFTRAIELDKNYVWAITKRGEVYSQMEKYDEALADFNRAIELDGNNGDALDNRADIYHLLGKNDEAVMDLTRIIKLDNENVKAITLRGLIHKLLGKIDEAIADFTRAIELDNEIEPAFLGRGILFNSIGKYDEALADFNRAIDLDGSDARLFLVRGTIQIRKLRHKEALSDFTHAIELDVNYVWAYLCRGLIYSVQEEFDKSILDFSQIIRLNESDVVATLLRGIIYVTTGKLGEALIDFDRVIGLDKNLSWFAYLFRGTTYLQMGDNDKAFIDLKHFLSLGNESQLKNITWEQISEQLTDIDQKDLVFLFWSLFIADAVQAITEQNKSSFQTETLEQIMAELIRAIYPSSLTAQRLSTVVAIDPVDKDSIGRYVFEYRNENSLFDDSASIELPDGEFLGECGIGISETLRQGETTAVIAFDAWLFDKNTIATKTVVLASQYVYSDKALLDKLSLRGEIFLVEPGKCISIETITLKILATISELKYSVSDDVPVNSFFEHVRFELEVSQKKHE